MIHASLLINIFVLIPFCFLILFNNSRIEKVLGPYTTGRGILLAIYLTILLASISMIWRPDPKIIFTVLSMQIVYKTLSPITTKTLKNPVIISNLFIAIFHFITIISMIKSGMLF